MNSSATVTLDSLGHWGIPSFQHHFIKPEVNWQFSVIRKNVVEGMSEK